MNTNANSSTTSHWLHKTTTKLIESGITTARLDCLVLLEDFTFKDRGWLLGHPEFMLKNTAELDLQIERRALHEPLAYIRGKSEFYGREFIINKHTLEPRPETETIIDLVKSLVKSRENLVIADIGTGSGCIAVSVKLDIPTAKIIATEIDVKALEIARENSKKLKADVTIYEGNLLEPIEQNIDILLCNLPYVPEDYELNDAARFEPEHAIFGGVDGLDLYRELFEQILERDQLPKHILTESLPFQHEQLSKIAKAANYTLQATEDFIQVFTALEQPLI